MEKSTKKTILEKIEKEKIEPVPKSHFEWKHRLVWMLVGLGIFFGAAFASFLIEDIIEFFSFGPGFFNGFSILFFVPHVFWLLVITGVFIFAYKEFRATKTGYRYSKKLVASIIVAVIILGSLVVFKVGLGPSMHPAFKQMPFVPNILYNEKTWDNPKDGRLAGKAMGPISSSGWFMLESFNGERYSIRKTQETFVSPKVTVEEGEKLRIFGAPTGKEFTAKGIMPWFGKGMMNPDRMKGRHRGSGQYPGMMSQPPF